jgi:hypothetical protein
VETVALTDVLPPVVTTVTSLRHGSRPERRWSFAVRGRPQPWAYTTNVRESAEPPADTDLLEALRAVTAWGTPGCSGK